MRTAPAYHPQAAAEQPQEPHARRFNLLDIEAVELAPAVRDVRSALEHERRDSLRNCYRIGQAVDKHYRRLEREHDGVNWPKRGDRYFEQLAEAVDSDPGWLRQHFRLVRTYDEKEFERLCRIPAMTPTKALQITGLDAPLRARLVQKIAEEGLTVRELQAAIEREVGPRRRPGAGRPPKRPKKLKDAFVHLTTQAERFVRHNNAVWFGAEYDIADQLHKLPFGELTEELQTQIVDAAEKCEVLAAAAAKDAQALRGALVEIDRRRKAQADLMKKQQAELEEEKVLQQQLRAERQAHRAPAGPRPRPPGRREIGRAARALSG